MMAELSGYPGSIAGITIRQYRIIGGTEIGHGRHGCFKVFHQVLMSSNLLRQLGHPPVSVPVHLYKTHIGDGAGACRLQTRIVTVSHFGREMVGDSVSVPGVVREFREGVKAAAKSP